MKKAVILRGLLVGLVLGVLVLGHSACGNSYNSPTSPPMTGTPQPTPRY